MKETRLFLRIQNGECHGKSHRVSIIVPPGLVGMQYGWRGNQNSQVLIPRTFDKLSGYAPYTLKPVLKSTKEALIMSRYGILVNADNCIWMSGLLYRLQTEYKAAPNIQWNQIHRNENVKKTSLTTTV